MYRKIQAMTEEDLANNLFKELSDIVIKLGPCAEKINHAAINLHWLATTIEKESDVFREEAAEYWSTFEAQDLDELQY